MSLITSALRPAIWPRLAFVLSLAMLCAAWAFQYIGGLAPCQMCYWQRHAHKAVLGTAALTIIFQYLSVNRSLFTALSKLGLWLIALAFALSLGLAFWHVGVEYAWWEGPKTCMVTPSGPISMKDFQDSLNQPIKAPACSDVAWSLFGLSMAGWNALVSAPGMLISLYVASRKPA